MNCRVIHLCSSFIFDQEKDVKMGRKVYVVFRGGCSKTGDVVRGLQS
jgi:hypothetical protein